MENAESILVVILSSVLAIFLVLGIALLVMIIKITKRIKHIVEKAEDIVDKADHIGEFFKNASGPLAMLRVVSNLVSSVINRDAKKSRRKD